MRRFLLLLAAIAASACNVDKGEEAPDASRAEIRCSSCEPDEICVVFYDGLCTEIGDRCVPRTCDTCSSECEAELCNSDGQPPHYTCMATPCGKEPAGAFACYGP